MTEFTETIQFDPKTQRDVNLSVDMYSKNAHETKYRLKQNAIVQAEIYEEATEILGVTIDVLTEKFEYKDNKVNASVQKRYFK